MVEDNKRIENKSYGKRKRRILAIAKTADPTAYDALINDHLDSDKYPVVRSDINGHNDQETWRKRNIISKIFIFSGFDFEGIWQLSDTP